MKRLPRVALATALSAGSAVAADLPSRKAPPTLPPAPSSWSGFYAGLNAGGTWSSDSAGDSINGPVGTGWSAVNGALSGPLPSVDSNGFVGGAQLGYNWAFGRYLAGLEADIQGVSASGGERSASNVVNTFSGSTTPFVGGVTILFPINVLSTVTVRQSLDYLGTIRGRLGWLYTPTLLLYGTGGLAYGGAQSTVGNAQIYDGGAVTGVFNSGSGTLSDTRVGWTGGGGVEWMFWPNWSAKAEYLYYDLENARTRFFNYNSASGLPVSVSEVSTRSSGHVLRGGLNYHFDWGGGLTFPIF
jgi:outer membrane immunogenic protein